MSSPDLFNSLREVVVKRRTGEGEFSYLYLPSGEAVAGKKAVFKLLKSDEACYDNLKACFNILTEHLYLNLINLI